MQSFKEYLFFKNELILYNNLDINFQTFLILFKHRIVRRHSLKRLFIVVNFVDRQTVDYK